MTMTATYLETVRENLSDLGGEMTYLKVVVPVQVVYTSKARRCIWLKSGGPLHIPPEVRSPDPGLYPDDLAPFVPGSGLGCPKMVEFVPG